MYKNGVKKESDTLREIKQQPVLWRKVVDLVKGQKELIESYLKELSVADSEVIFTGAGSSFFIGEMIAPFFQKDSHFSARAIETTELVTHPAHHINPERKTLLVSFARSGNSPESVAAVNLANQVSNNVKHLIITCNKNGALAKMDGDNFLTLVMPDEANDKSLAMTSSVTSMGLTALLIGRLARLEEMKNAVVDASDLVLEFFEGYTELLAKAGDIEYERAVFLGSGPMKGVAHEAHLKLQELTDGQIICKFDSFLGFRHGPKAVVNDQTLMVYFFANDPYVRQYEMDLVRSMRTSHNPVLSVGICNNPINDIKLDLDIRLSSKVLDDAIWTIASLVPAQLLAYYKSVSMDFDPDAPSKSGAIHRVVQGVTIYEHK